MDCGSHIHDTSGGRNIIEEYGKNSEEEIPLGFVLAMNDKELEFSVFCIESVAERLGCKGERVYELLLKAYEKRYIIIMFGHIKRYALN